MKKTAKCTRCSNLFDIKDIYTIQQFQYRKVPPYSWCMDYFAKKGIGEWDSFCESCIIYYQKESLESYQK
ncbi:hypothetical protein [Candidatus Nitrosotenuis aquarius]|uniref:hypothetical protein n=1 Tax=Candidatus Nitrosotenuis aquarius TaxID=1846278 RepID=UPI000C1F75F3|nr:hypothetical protein [Candidatus Nitrosotenuis aquarius]